MIYLLPNEYWALLSLGFGVGLCTGLVLAEAYWKRRLAQTWFQGVRDRPLIDQALSEFREGQRRDS